MKTDRVIVISEAKITAKAKHACLGCLEDIKPKETYIKRKVFVNHIIWRNAVSHESCVELADQRLKSASQYPK